MGSAISQLDASNGVSAVAGSDIQYQGFADGVGPDAKFGTVKSLAADGQGILWVADWTHIRRLDTRSGAVTTLAGAQAPDRDLWQCLAFDPAAGTLWAATSAAVCRVRTEGSGGAELVAGDWEEGGISFDGAGAAAGFTEITALLPLPGGRLLIADGPDLRCVDAGGAVTTLLRGCFPKDGGRQMALLPSGELGVSTAEGDVARISGGDFALLSTNLLLSLLAPPAMTEGTDGSGSTDPPAPSGTVVVRVGDRAFPVQRSVLAAGSEYFTRLLAPGGGFAESDAAEVALPDADPAAFAHLLSYMYGTAMGHPGTPSQLLVVPPELLRPMAALVGRLLMGGAVAALTERLAAAATPASVLSDLTWADAHDMTDLVERLRGFAVWNRKALEPAVLRQLVREFPEQAAELLVGVCRSFR